MAAYEGNPEAVDMLLDHGANIYATDKEDKTVLYWAAASNKLNTIKVQAYKVINLFMFLLSDMLAQLPLLNLYM